MAGVRNHSNDKLLLYVDGVLQGVSTINVDDVTNTTGLLLAHGNSLDSPFTGLLDEIRFSDRALTPAEFLIPVVASRPVACYPLDGDGTDVSGNGRHGTLLPVNGGPTPTTDRFGNPGKALALDGVDDWVKASGAGLPEGERTVALWFKPDQVENPCLLGYGGGSCGTSLFMAIYPPSVPAPYNGLYVSSHCGANSLHSATNPSLGVWHHWAVTTEATGTRMYLDGAAIAVNTNFIANTTTAGTDLAIGVDVSPGGYGPYVDSNVGYFRWRSRRRVHLLTGADGE